MKNLKKLTLVIVAVCMIFCVVSIFTACEEEGCTNHVDANEDGKCDNCGTPVESDDGGEENDGPKTYTAVLKDTTGSVVVGAQVKLVVDNVDKETKTTDTNGKVSFELNEPATEISAVIVSVPEQYGYVETRLSYSDTDYEVVFEDLYKKVAYTITVKCGDEVIEGAYVQLCDGGTCRLAKVTDETGKVVFYEDTAMSAPQAQVTALPFAYTTDYTAKIDFEGTATELTVTVDELTMSTDYENPVVVNGNSIHETEYVVSLPDSEDMYYFSFVSPIDGTFEIFQVEEDSFQVSIEGGNAGRKPVAEGEEVRFSFSANFDWETFESVGGDFEVVFYLEEVYVDCIAQVTFDGVGEEGIEVGLYTYVENENWEKEYTAVLDENGNPLVSRTDEEGYASFGNVLERSNYSAKAVVTDTNYEIYSAYADLYINVDEDYETTLMYTHVLDGTIEYPFVINTPFFGFESIDVEVTPIESGSTDYYQLYINNWEAPDYVISSDNALLTIKAYYDSNADGEITTADDYLAGEAGESVTIESNVSYLIAFCNSNTNTEDAAIEPSVVIDKYVEESEGGNTGSGTSADPYLISSADTYEFTVDSEFVAVYYTITVETAGTVTITAGTDVIMATWYVNPMLGMVGENPLDDSSLYVVEDAWEGDEIKLVVRGGGNGTYNFTLTYGSVEEGGVTGSGTDADPYLISSADTYEFTVDSEFVAVYYTITVETAGTVTITAGTDVIMATWYVNPMLGMVGENPLDDSSLYVVENALAGDEIKLVVRGGGNGTYSFTLTYGDAE